MTRWLATLSTSAESDDSTQLRMKRMNFISRTTLFLLLFLSLVFIAAPCATGKLYAQSDPDEDREAGTELTPEAVRDSIEGGVEFLRKQQSTRGSWKEYPGYEPGTTALCVGLINRRFRQRGSDGCKGARISSRFLADEAESDVSNFPSNDGLLSRRS